ncbi:MAG TPA: filamentous hemagglutinin N-terminal domain-containing protein [Oculatellaceae cyanobacterium]|jgi:filamentous hemagglutinin family protein
MRSGIYCVLFYTSISLFSPVNAQITSDSTLPNTSNVTKQGNTFIIEAGTKTGSNLFHSFSQFSIPTGTTAFFNNVAEVQNIFSRVTGQDISSIDGIIKANGTANLFLLNPNGIIFGTNAKLNIGGSFVETTASAIAFANQGLFSVSSPTNLSLLTVNPNALLFNQIASQPLISVRGTSLQVPQGKSLLLVGGNISLDGGQLLAPGGRIELGGLLSAGTIELNLDKNLLSLNFPNSVARGDVELRNNSEASVRTGGSLFVNAHNLLLSQTSRLRAGIAPGMGDSSLNAGDIVINADGNIKFSDTSFISNAVSAGGKGNAGDLRIQAAGTISFTGVNTTSLVGGIFSQIADNAVGSGGNIEIDTGKLLLTEGAQIIASTRGQGNAGNVNINAREAVVLDGFFGEGYPGGIFSTVSSAAVGNGGDVNIKTLSLSLTNGAEITASTFGLGNAGNIKVNATGSVTASGVTPLGFSGGLFSSSNQDHSGTGGNIEVIAGALHISDGAGLIARTRSNSAGGNILVNANNISLLSAGKIATTAFGNGNAGSIEIFANNINISGSNPALAQQLAQVGVPIYATTPLSGIFANTEEGSRGIGGSINVKTNSLSIRNQAGMSVGSLGQGSAGNLQMLANSLNFDRQAFLSAETAFGEGGNISLNTRSLQLRHDSSITAKAGGTGNGGNLNIATDTLISLEGSNITANAVGGRGGNVQISTQGIFLSPDSGITATSAMGPQFDGVVEIKNLGQDVRNSLSLPEANFVSAEQMLVGSCFARHNAQQGRFTITGTGALPMSPYTAIDEMASLTEVEDQKFEVTQSLPSIQQESTMSQVMVDVPTNRNLKLVEPLVEAQSLVKLPDGRIFLSPVAQNVQLEQVRSHYCQR